MTDSKTRPQVSEKGQSQAELRRQRQAEALRANLARRKAQSRGRADDHGAPVAATETRDGAADGG